MKVILLLSVFAVCSVARHVSVQREPSFCHDLECPHFTVKNNTSEYQERCYQQYKWVSTVVTGDSYMEDVRMGFMRLFHYIEGKNTKSAKIPMTAPVLVQIQPSYKNKFTVNFFVPFNLQKNPIPPSSKDVFVSSLPKMCVYAKSFGGFVFSESKVQENAAVLKEALHNDGLQDAYHKDFYYYAGYDSPFRLVGRHNEIWFVKK